MSEKRVWELTEAQSTKSGDFLLIDNENDATSYKILPSKIGATYTITPTATGFSFDGSNGYHQDVAIPQDPEINYATYSALSEAQKMDGSNRFVTDWPDEVKEPEIWTRVGRTPLQTVAKVISNAINELKGRIDGNDDDITEIKSNLTKLEVKAKYVTYSVTVPTTYTEYLGSATVNFYNLALNSSADFPTGKNILAIIPQTCSASSGTQRALVDIGAGDFSDPRAYIFGKGNNTYTLTILVLYTEP